MNIIKDKTLQDYTLLVEEYKQKLINCKHVELASHNEVDHVAAYIAWNTVGGVLFVRNLWQPDYELYQVIDFINESKNKDVIIFNTSGTTGTPKIVEFSKKDLLAVEQRTTKNLNWSPDTVYLNLLPVFSSGFWFLVLLSAVANNATIVCSSKNTIKDDFDDYPVTSTTLVPGLIDYLRLNNIKLPLNKLTTLTTGGSPVYLKHVQYCFDNNAVSFTNTYGTTETGAPILTHVSYQLDEYVDCLRITDEVKFVDNELVFQGIYTGDVFDFVSEDLIRFKGRKNDIVSVNGSMCSLVYVESKFEELDSFGECIAVVRNRLGVDYIEIYYTEGIVDSNFIINKLSEVMPKQSIPRKYTKIDKIPRNALNKKVRRDL